MKMPSGPTALLLMSTGFIVWAISFVVLYSGLSLGCLTETTPEQRSTLGSVNLWLAVFWLAHVAILVWLLRRAWRLRTDPDALPAARRFAIRATRYLTAAALFATVWIGAPIVFLPPCV